MECGIKQITPMNDCMEGTPSMSLSEDKTGVELLVIILINIIINVWQHI